MNSSFLVNHIMYADDFVVFSPLCSGLQQLLHICFAYDVENEQGIRALSWLIEPKKRNGGKRYPEIKPSVWNLTVCSKI